VSLLTRDMSMCDVNVFKACGAKWNHSAGLWKLNQCRHIIVKTQVEVMECAA